MQPTRMQGFTVTVFADQPFPAKAGQALQHIAFLFSVEKKSSGETKSQRAAPTALSKSSARKPCPKLR
jgi:hypothetical protein